MDIPPDFHVPLTMHCNELRLVLTFRPMHFHNFNYFFHVPDIAAVGTIFDFLIMLQCYLSHFRQRVLRQSRGLPFVNMTIYGGDGIPELL